MKKILFLILFLTGITPVFKNNSLNLGCVQMYAQESNNGQEEDLEGVTVCPQDNISSERNGDWVTTTTCSYENDPEDKTKCIETCDENTVFDPETPANPCDDPFNTDPLCNTNCSNQCPPGMVLNLDCGCDPEPCNITCGEGFRVTSDCGCEEIPPPSNCRVACLPGYTEVNCVCVQNPPPPTDPDPCNEAAAIAGTNTSNLFKDDDIQNSLGNILPLNIPQNEFGFTIKNMNGNITATALIEGDSTGVVITGYTNNSIADVHTHPTGGFFAPSANDLFRLDYLKTNISGFSTSFIVSSDGNVYALVIDNATKLKAFVNSNPGFVGSDKSFKIGTPMGDLFDSTRKYLETSGYSSQEAYTRATALILQNAGVSLLKADATTMNFKKISIIEVGTDSSGKPIYITINC